jgi:hypothetical protein
MQIEEILNEREEQYGNFLNRSKISQDFKTLIHNGESYRLLKADQKEALEMIATKMGRIVNGDPDYLDSWLDIQGYCQLVIDRVRKDKIALDNAVDMYVVEGVPKETAIQLQRSDDE